MGRLLRYLQQVTSTGYRWVEGEEEEAPTPDPAVYERQEAQPAKRRVDWLTDGIPFGTACEGFVYNALAKPRLFRDFAALGRYWSDDMDTLREQIRKFANGYGLLGVESHMVSIDGPVAAVAELLEDWGKAIRDLYLAVELWDNIRENKQDALRECIEWHDTLPRVVYVSAGLAFEIEGQKLYARQSLIADERINSRKERVKWESLQPGGVIRPARWLLQKWVNEALQETLSGVLFWHGKPGEGEFQLHYQPTSLLSAMWCQLAREIAANEHERVCEYEHCGKPLENIRRSTKRFCSDSCRTLHDRQRKRQRRCSQRES